MRRTVLRETRNSRAIALIFLPFTWNSRRTRPIVSTVSIPASPSSATRTNEGILDQTGWGQDCTPITPTTGAKLHAGSQQGGGRGATQGGEGACRNESALKTPPLDALQRSGCCLFASE